MAKMWSVRAVEAIDKWTALLDLFNKYPDLRAVCSSSDSNKQSIECWCAECKELVASITQWESLPLVLGTNKP